MAVENETSPRPDFIGNDRQLDKGATQEPKGADMLISVYSGEDEFERHSLHDLGHAIEKTEVDMDEASETQAEEDEEDVADAGVAQKQANSYAAKKTVAQGMMDIALITANANQLRYIIEFNRNSSTFYLNLILIIISLLLQIAVGVSLIFKGRLDLRGESKHKNAKRINNHVVIGIFLVTIINVFIASFTVTNTGNK